MNYIKFNPSHKQEMLEDTPSWDYEKP